ncbi:metal-dependent transcriptional regulator [Pinibacter aurantiacus]|uniref:Transcriptional regulator MntR n=1 Tax=Pinibacter aurantiacus TaxID=2851599 RepID=A0A9E2SF23_9BACT|nr:metal-dependent transcriptional regulator [Pinibacter aurantiacus]MBV4359600.1 metal-dependent transcriptional regulator [Pinibacter aurantiacus]
MKYSSSKENYIKAIFHLQRSSENVSTNALANALQTKPASVTDMLKKLKEQKILQYERYKGVRLTAEGKKIALLIIRKHRLWEYFLVEKLQFGWEEVHEIAEELEHISSKKLIDRLDDFLGNPRKDPHGDPIPDANGKMPVLQQISLDSIQLNKPMEITGIGNQTPELMELLQRTNIKIGSKLEVKKKFSFDNSLEIKMRNAAPFIISQFLAKNLLVNDEE